MKKKTVTESTMRVRVASCWSTPKEQQDFAAMCKRKGVDAKFYDGDDDNSNWEFIGPDYAVKSIVEDHFQITPKRHDFDWLVKQPELDAIIDGKSVLGLFESEKPSTKEAKEKIGDAKSEAAKLKTPEDVKKFMAANKSKIATVSGKLKGNAKKNFDKIVEIVDSYSKQVNESELSVKVICGLVAVIMWLCSLDGAWIAVAASPIIAPLLVGVLKKVGLNESAVEYGKYLYVTKNNPSFKRMVRKVGASGLRKKEDPYGAESLTAKLSRYSTCVPYDFEKAYQLYIPIGSDLRQLEQELFALIVEMGGARWNKGQDGEKELFSVNDSVMAEIVAKFIEDHPGVEER